MLAQKGPPSNSKGISKGNPMTDNPPWEICERVAEVQALLHDLVECGKHSAADVVAKAQAVLSESKLLRAMFEVGYFPTNTRPPGE